MDASGSGVEPIELIGIATDEVGKPRNDGSRGSGLYVVPIRLSHAPSELWAGLFAETWNSPPQFTTMHRPGIASVQGDKIILDGTTIEEVERHHAVTLRHVVDKVNQDVAAIEATEDSRRQEADRAERQHRDRVREVADRIRFD